ncbi:MAG: NmrA family NAD(P)-binding protein [Anaerolineae bacterium]
MLLVTGAAGKTGRALIRALAARGAAVRAMVHRPEQAERLKALGASEVLAGDLRDARAVGRAMAGARAVYHICPNVHPDEVTIGQVAIDAAREAGVDLFVYHSVLHPQVEAMPHHWRKMRVEERLFASGLDTVILQPAAYQQNVLGQWTEIVRDGVYEVPYGLGTRLSMVDLEDVAAVAARVLTEPGHAGATYELAGPQPLAQTEVAAVLGRQFGRRVEARQVPLEAWAQQARAAGLGQYQVETLLQMFRYYDRHGFWGNPRVLGHLLGRPPARFEVFVARAAGALQGGFDAV